jgi:hypothetical protein
MATQDKMDMLDDLWTYFHQQHTRACRDAEREVVAGRLDKNFYIERDQRWAAAVFQTKAALRSRYRQLLEQGSSGGP